MVVSVKDNIVYRIYGRGRGAVIGATDFMADFKRVDIDKALSELTKEGTIERIIPGVYYYPEYNELIKQKLSPKIEKVADAIARKFKWDIQPTGNTALNYFQLSTQVPANYEYISDGPSREYTVAGQKITFKHMKMADVKLKYMESKLLVQAIKALLEEQITQSEINALKKRFDAKIRKNIKKDTSNVTGWVRDVILKICKDTSDG